MSAGLEAIANELKRLQRDGVSRVFVEDDTMRLIVPKQKASSSSERVSAPPLKPEELGDLKELVHEVPTAEGKASAKSTSAPKVVTYPPAPEIELPTGDAATQLTWLRDQVLACEVCKEHLSEHGKIVFGSGSPEADILFCGEAPGAEEETEGEPFIGKPGQLLSKIVTTMGLTRESVYMANILKWRPEHDKPYGNRPPTDEEMRFCLPYLQAQIQIVKPKVIVALGGTVVAGLLGSDPERKMGSVRGTWASFEDIPVMITFHPSYLLRNGTLKTKRMAWEDMLQVMEKCALDISDQQRVFFLSKT
jgi:uracil-DNA glycosylase family 4